MEQVALSSQEDCLMYLARLVERTQNMQNPDTKCYYIRQLLNDKVLPHIGTD